MPIDNGWLRKVEEYRQWMAEVAGHIKDLQGQLQTKDELRDRWQERCQLLEANLHDRDIVTRKQVAQLADLEATILFRDKQIDGLADKVKNRECQLETFQNTIVSLEKQLRDERLNNVLYARKLLELERSRPVRWAARMAGIDFYVRGTR